MSNTIIVYYNGNGLIVFETVAKSFNLHEGYRINTEKEFWEILNANASHTLSLCEAELHPKN